MGANLIADGATFRVWAPHALKVYVLGDFNNRVMDDSSLLTKDANGHWRGFIKGRRTATVTCSTSSATGSEGPKRDPYARELADAVSRRLHRPRDRLSLARDRIRHAAFHDFVIYQLHVGTFFTPNLPSEGGTFLDVARKIPYLAGLGVTAIQLLPIQEFQTEFSLGYNGTDYFSPEMDFAVEDAALGAVRRAGATGCSTPKGSPAIGSTICAAR